MELAVSNCLLAMVFAVAAMAGSADGLQAEYSDKELMGLADMLRSSKTSSRSARDMDDHHHKKHLNYKHCCGGMDSRNHTGRKETWKIVKKCIEQEKAKSNDTEYFVNPITDEFSCERLKRDKNRHYCIADCVLKEVGALQGNDAVNKDIAKEFLTKGISAEWLKEIAEKGVEKCIEEKDNTLNGEQLECNPRAGYIRHCMWKEVILIM
nr:odorant-binding protein 11 [Eocanthecona furcellata]